MGTVGAQKGPDSAGLPTFDWPQNCANEKHMPVQVCSDILQRLAFFIASEIDAGTVVLRVRHCSSTTFTSLADKVFFIRRRPQACKAIACFACAMADLPSVTICAVPESFLILKSKLFVRAAACEMALKTTVIDFFTCSCLKVSTYVFKRFSSKEVSVAQPPHCGHNCFKLVVWALISSMNPRTVQDFRLSTHFPSNASQFLSFTIGRSHWTPVMSGSLKVALAKKPLTGHDLRWCD
jgi:hypothetical protein